MTAAPRPADAPEPRTGLHTVIELMAAQIVHLRRALADAEALVVKAWADRAVADSELDATRRALDRAEATAQRLRDILKPLLDHPYAGGTFYCQFCRGSLEAWSSAGAEGARHTPDCPVLEKDALLGRTDAGGAGPGGTEVVHLCPPDGSGLMPCCGRTPFEAPPTERMTRDAALVTCRGASTKEA